MFTPRMTDDPATGSAASALTALLATLQDKMKLDLHISQGIDMGRASSLYTCFDAMSGDPVTKVGERRDYNGRDIQSLTRKSYFAEIAETFHIS